MKKLLSVGLLFTLILALTACSSQADSPELLTKEGIAPYELSDSELQILQSFGMDSTSQIISFYAPEAATSLTVNVYRLEEDEKWNKIGDGTLFLAADRESTDQLAGTFTMQLRENYAIDFNINGDGRASFKTDELSSESESLSSIKEFLQEFQPITLNQEIPVALMVYDSGTSMKSYSLQDYFEPSKFSGMDLVQVVTLEFSDK